ncbi:unnamed protein product [Leptosia nina]|uniref:Uncharacterized protein n=1 Tax=Leptosia nina TaxID=320188 RepID=A0AAV1K3G4_9NEOP
MSIFFFRFHNLRRAEEKRMRRVNKTNMNSENMTAPSRLLERPLSQPTDSLDEIALQIPRKVQFYSKTAITHLRPFTAATVAMIFTLY